MQDYSDSYQQADAMPIAEAVGAILELEKRALLIINQIERFK